MADRQVGGGHDGSLPVDAELRIALGLDFEERVSLLARGARTLLL